MQALLRDSPWISAASSGTQSRRRGAGLWPAELGQRIGLRAAPLPRDLLPGPPRLHRPPHAPGPESAHVACRL
eukprot:3249663-Alexandrium_andersonii.AAC.1